MCLNVVMVMRMCTKPNVRVSECKLMYAKRSVCRKMYTKRYKAVSNSLLTCSLPVTVHVTLSKATHTHTHTHTHTYKQVCTDAVDVCVERRAERGLYVLRGKRREEGGVGRWERKEGRGERGEHKCSAFRYSLHSSLSLSLSHTHTHTHKALG
jgi:hypothetical protein